MSGTRDEERECQRTSGGRNTRLHGPRWAIAGLQIAAWVSATLTLTGLGCPTRITCPPDDVWEQDIGFGTMSARRRIWADRAHRTDSLRDYYGVQDRVPRELVTLSDISPGTDSVEWVLMDPDDPATSNPPDSSNNGNDNRIRGRLTEGRQSGRSVSDTVYKSAVVDNEASVYLELYTSSPGDTFYYPGDDFYLVASRTGDTVTVPSCTMSVWKRMHVEVDCPENGMSSEIDSMIALFGSYAPWPFLGMGLSSNLVDTVWDPNYCTYLDPSRHIIAERSQISSVCTLNYQANPDIVDAIWAWSKRWIDDTLTQNPDVVWLGITGGMCEDSAVWAPPLTPGWEHIPWTLGMSSRDDPFEWPYIRHFSLVLAESVYKRASTVPSWDPLVMTMMLGLSVGVHEMGHQVAKLPGNPHCSDVNCVMHSPFRVDQDSATLFEPHYCGNCVQRIRTEGKVQQFGSR